MDIRQSNFNRDALGIGATLLLPISLLFAAALAREIAGQPPAAAHAAAGYAAAARPAPALEAPVAPPAARLPSGAPGHAPGYTRGAHQA